MSVLIEFPRSTGQTVSGSLRKPRQRVAGKTLVEAQEKWLRSCSVNGLASKSIDWYTERSGKFLDWVKNRGITLLIEVSSQTVIDYLNDLRAGGSSPATVRGCYNVLNIFFRRCVEEKFLRKNPMTGMRRPPVTKDKIPVADRRDIDLLIREAHRASRANGPKGAVGLRDETVIKLVFDTGLRLSEVVGLRLENVDARGTKLCVLGKGNKERWVYFGEEVRKQLQRYLRSRNAVVTRFNPTLRGPDAPFFVTHHGRPLTRSGLVVSYRRLRGKVGVRARFHGLRHAFAAAWATTGGNPFALKEQLGHTSMDMTQVYVRAFGESRRDEAKRHSPVDNFIKG